MSKGDVFGMYFYMFMNLCLKTRAGSECGSLLKCKLHFCGNYLSKCMLKIS